MIKVSLPYPVSTNRGIRNYGGKSVVSKEAAAYKRNAGKLAIEAGARPVAGDIHVTMTLLPKMNKDGSESAVRLDIDNCIKVALDSMNGVAWIDDKQIRFLAVGIGDPVKGGGLTIEIRKIERIGI